MGTFATIADLDHTLLALFPLLLVTRLHFFCFWSLVYTVSFRFVIILAFYTIGTRCNGDLAYFSRFSLRTGLDITRVWGSSLLLLRERRLGHVAGNRMHKGYLRFYWEGVIERETSGFLLITSFLAFVFCNIRILGFPLWTGWYRHGHGISR